MKKHSKAIPTTFAELKIGTERSKKKVRERRWRCQKKVKIWQGMKKSNCNMVDFSSGGACLTEVDNISKGSKIIIGLPHSSVSAEVVWVIGSRCGIQFAKSLTRDEILAIWKGDATQPQQSLRPDDEAPPHDDRKQEDDP